MNTELLPTKNADYELFCEIYGLVDPLVPATVVYVGCTTDLDKRLSQHCYTSSDTPIGRWCKQLREAGRKPLAVRLATTRAPFGEMVEQRFIELFQSPALLNVLKKPVLQLDTKYRENLKTLAEIERDYVEAVLAFCGRNKAEAATVLGISRPSLYKRLSVSESASLMGSKGKGVKKTLTNEQREAKRERMKRLNERKHGDANYETTIGPV